MTPRTPTTANLRSTLIRKSARNASAKLQFCRLAFGAAGSAGAQIDTGDAENMTRGFLEDEKTKVAWNLPRTLQPKNRVKLLLNMLIIAQQTIPRGGTLTVDALGQGDAGGLRIRAAGLNARLPQNIADQLAGAQQGTIDAHAVQPYYTRLLAQASRPARFACDGWRCGGRERRLKLVAHLRFA